MSENPKPPIRSDAKKRVSPECESEGCESHEGELINDPRFLTNPQVLSGSIYATKMSQLPYESGELQRAKNNCLPSLLRHADPSLYWVLILLKGSENPHTLSDLMV